MARKIDNTLVEDFIKDQIALEKLTIKVAATKAKLRKLDEKGYEHPLLRFEDNVSFRPDWKKLVKELTEKYLTQGARSVFFNRTIKRRFKPTHGKKTIAILSPRYETFKDSVAELKKKLGLVSSAKE